MQFHNVLPLFVDTHVTPRHHIHVQNGFKSPCDVQDDHISIAATIM